MKTYVLNRDGSKELCRTTQEIDYIHCKKCEKSCRTCDTYTIGDRLRHNCMEHENCLCHETMELSGKVVVEILNNDRDEKGWPIFVTRAIHPQYLIEEPE